MKKAKFLLVLLLLLATIGGIHANAVQKLIYKIWYYNPASNRCNLFFLADLAYTTNDDYEGALSTPSATHGHWVEPPVSQCAYIIYYLPEP